MKHLKPGCYKGLFESSIFISGVTWGGGGGSNLWVEMYSQHAGTRAPPQENFKHRC